MALVHLTLAARGNLALFPTEHQQRAAIHCLAKAVGDCLSLFNVLVVHTHIAADDGNATGSLKRKLRYALNPVASAPITEIWDEPVRDRKHAGNLVRYFVTQVLHHKIDVHPALQTGSCIHDLLGTRHVPGLVLQTEHVGNPRPSELLELAGLRTRALTPVSDEEIRALGACRLRAAATAALAVGPALSGRSTPVVLARRVTVQLGLAAGIPRSELAHALGVHRGSLTKLALGSVPADVFVVVRMRLALEQAVAAATQCTFRLWR